MSNSFLIGIGEGKGRLNILVSQNLNVPLDSSIYQNNRKVTCAQNTVVCVDQHTEVISRTVIVEV